MSNVWAPLHCGVCGGIASYLGLMWSTPLQYLETTSKTYNKAIIAAYSLATLKYNVTAGYFHWSSQSVGTIVVSTVVQRLRLEHRHVQRVESWVVREDCRGRLIFPPDLPKERGCKAQIFASLSMAVSLLEGFLSVSNKCMRRNSDMNFKLKAIHELQQANSMQPANNFGVFEEESPLNRTLQLVHLGGLDYGSGMAYSFFYGYLQFMLPNKGDSNKGTYFKSLDEENRNVAGVQARSYKNSIYKIRSPDNTELVYLAVEGATPVKTYYNVMRQDPQKGDSDKNGQPLDLSDILKTKLQEIKERHQPAVIESLCVNINVTETQPESVQLLESPTRHA
uniref:STING ligand-binding domain-containing protein n=1 Tax=Timema genevievae TaxID=629358 RepID=A0A7R9PJZ0_TIMGE|nr:unnamed protein product [Timema genevievae]